MANKQQEQQYDIENNFTYHAPKKGQQETYEKIRAGGRELAELLVNEVPVSRELSVALTNLEQAIFWANAGLARNS